MKKASRLLRNIALLMAMLILVSVPVTIMASEGYKVEPDMGQRMDQVDQEVLSGDNYYSEDDYLADSDTERAYDEKSIESGDDLAMIKEISQRILGSEQIQSNTLPTPDAVVTAEGVLSGIDGAPWWLYSDGTLVVGSGMISQSTSEIAFSPWSSHRRTIRNIVFTGPITAGPSLNGLFGNLSMVNIDGLEFFDVSNVESMVNMFADAESLASLDLSSWNTGNVTNMRGMFMAALSLERLNVANWDTRNVTDMGSMFSYTWRLESVDVSNWDTNSVTNMTGMFYEALRLSSLDVSNWDTGSVTSMMSMFNRSNVATLDLSNWNTGNVVSMRNMFAGAENLSSLDVSNWDTGNVTSMFGMFAGASSLASLDLSNWDTGSVTNMHVLFQSMYSLRELILGTNFEFVGGATVNLPRVAINAPYTGYWQNVAQGTSSAPQGEYELTSPELIAFHNRNPRQETWVWQLNHDCTTCTYCNECLSCMDCGECLDYGDCECCPDCVSNPCICYVCTNFCTDCGYCTNCEYCECSKTHDYCQNCDQHPCICCTICGSEPCTCTPVQQPPPTGGNGFGGGGSGGSTITVPTQVVEVEEDEVPLAQWDGVHHAFMVGFADGTIRPMAEVTRAQAATMLFRLMSDEDRTRQWTQNNQFSDVLITNWFNNAVSTTASTGIFAGMTGGTFMPNQAVTRAELAVMIVRFVEAEPVSGAPQFNDITDHWAQYYINAAAQSGWVIGTDASRGQFRPDETITRAEAAATINRALSRLPQSPDELLLEMRTWSDNSNPNAWYYLYIQEATNSHYYKMHEDGVHHSWVKLVSPEHQWSLLERPESQPEDILSETH